MYMEEQIPVSRQENLKNKNEKHPFFLDFKTYSKYNQNSILTQKQTNSPEETKRNFRNKHNQEQEYYEWESSPVKANIQ